MDIRTEVDRLFDDSSLPPADQPIAVIISGDVGAAKTTLHKQKYATGYVVIDAVGIFLDLNRGDFLIDGRETRGAAEFEGELIAFGSERFPGWQAVMEFLGAASQDTSPAIGSRQDG